VQAHNTSPASRPGFFVSGLMIETTRGEFPTLPTDIYGSLWSR